MSNYKYRTSLRLPSGKRKEIYSNDKEDFEKKKTEARMLLCAGVDIGDGMTFGEYAQMWYNVYKKPNLRTSSRAGVESVLNVHLLPRMERLKMRDISPMLIMDVLNGLSDSSRSLNAKVVQTIRSIFNTAVDNGILVKSPVPISLRASGVSTQRREALSEEQEKTLLDAVAGTSAELFVLMGLKTGLRRGELLGLQWDAIDLTAGTVKVFRNLVICNNKTELTETPKTDAGFRVIPIPPSIVVRLKKERLATNSLFLFHMKNGDPLTPAGFRSLWGVVDSRRSVPLTPGKPDKHPWVKRTIDFEVTPHILRHTYATRLFEQGLDVKEVQYLLGHTNPEITMRIYVHYCQIQRQSETFEKVKSAMS